MSTLLEMLSEQYELLEKFANAQSRLVNATSTTSTDGRELTAATKSLVDYSGQLRSSLAQLEQNEEMRIRYSDHLLLCQRVVQTIAKNPSWHSNGIPYLPADSLQTNTVALATVKASIARIAETESDS